MIMMNDPPPRVIHIKLGNMRIKDFHQLISEIWKDVLVMSDDFKLIRVYSKRIEGID